jgi:hypothetical protein
MAWKTGDVLISVNESADSTKAIGAKKALVIQRATKMRMIFDHDRNKLFFASKYEGFSSKPDPNDPEKRLLAENASLNALIIDRNRSSSRWFPDRTSHVKEMNDDKIFNLKAQFQVPYLRGLGIFEFGRQVNFKNFIEGTHIKSVGRGAEKISGSDGQIKIQFRSQSPTDPNFVSLRGYTFDANAFVPLRKNTAGIVGGARGFISDIRIEWEDIDGVYVPKRITEELSKSKIVDKTDHVYILNRDIEFQWLSLNKRIDETRFDKKLLEDAGQIDLLLNPVSEDSANRQVR